MHWIRAEGVNSVTIKVFDDNRLGAALLPVCSDLRIAKGFREFYRIMSNKVMGEAVLQGDSAKLAFKPFLEA